MSEEKRGCEREMDERRKRANAQVARIRLIAAFAGRLSPLGRCRSQPCAGISRRPISYIVPSSRAVPKEHCRANHGGRKPSQDSRAAGRRANRAGGAGGTIAGFAASRKGPLQTAYTILKEHQPLLTARRSTKSQIRNQKISRRSGALRRPLIVLAHPRLVQNAERA